MILRSSFFQSALFAAVLAIALSKAGCAQAVNTPPVSIESPQDLISRLTPEQNDNFQNAMQAFGHGQYVAALTAFKQLLEELPGEPVISKFAAESALNTGDPQFAINAMRRIAGAAPDDWQAAALLTRACAESGDAKCRESGTAHMLDLYRRGLIPRNMPRYILERINMGDKTMLLWASLEPWGPYRVYYLGQVLNAQQQIYLRTTVESSDGDQGHFAREHPKEAAAGLRGFSLDAYAETGLNDSGQRAQTHYTYAFFVGEPSYDVVREKFLAIAQGKAAPLSSRTGLIVP